MRGPPHFASFTWLWLAVACGTEHHAPEGAAGALTHPDATASRRTDATAPRRTDATAPDGRLADACARCGDARTTRDARPRDAPTPSADGAAGIDASSAAPTDASIDHVVASDAAPPPHEEGGPPGYPVGPYGTQPGATFPYLKWEGYVATEDGPDAALVSSRPWTAYSSDAMRTSGKALALLHISDFDCPGCRHAALTMAAEGPSIVAAGGLVVEVLATHAFSSPATRAYLDAWVESYGFGMTSVIDAEGHDLATLNALLVRETALVIDLSDMRVLWRATGDLAGVDPPSLDGGFAEMHRRLGR